MCDLRCFLLGFLLSITVNTGQADRVDVLPLQHKLATEIVPVLQQSFPDASIQAFNGQLVVRAPDDATFDAITQLVAQLDTPNRQLAVTVEQRNGQASHSPLHVGGHVVISSRHGVGGRIEIITEDNTLDDDTLSRQTVLTMDGGRAMISLGQARFYPQLDFIYRPGYSVITRGGTWRQDETGFWVEPHVRGDQVQLRLYPYSNRHRPDGSVQTSGVYSEVAGQLGEWLPVGASSQYTQGSGVYRQGRYTVWVRVELH